MGGGFKLSFLDDLVFDDKNEIHDNGAPGFLPASGPAVFGMGGGGLIIGCFNLHFADNQVKSNKAATGPGLQVRQSPNFQITGNQFSLNTEIAAAAAAPRTINIYFNACPMGNQTAATVAAANPPMPASEILVYP